MNETENRLDLSQRFDTFGVAASEMLHTLVGIHTEEFDMGEVANTVITRAGDGWGFDPTYRQSPARFMRVLNDNRRHTCEHEEEFVPPGVDSASQLAAITTVEAATADSALVVGDRANLISEIDTLLIRIDALRVESTTAKSALVAEQERSAFFQNQVEARDLALARFKDRVVQVAWKYAKDHEWCEVVDNALGELGLSLPNSKFMATATITVQFTAERAGRGEIPSAYFVRQSLETDSIANALKDSDDFLDSDFENVEIGEVTVGEVTNVKEVQD